MTNGPTITVQMRSQPGLGDAQAEMAKAMIAYRNAHAQRQKRDQMQPGTMQGGMRSWITPNSMPNHALHHPGITEWAFRACAEASRGSHSTGGPVLALERGTGALRNGRFPSTPAELRWIGTTRR